MKAHELKALSAKNELTYARITENAEVEAGQGNKFILLMPAQCPLSTGTMTRLLEEGFSLTEYDDSFSGLKGLRIGWA